MVAGAARRVSVLAVMSLLAMAVALVLPSVPGLPGGGPRPAAAVAPGLSTFSGWAGTSGTPQGGLVDGAASVARFQDIQDMVLDPAGAFLYVLEKGVNSDSHAIRRVDVASGAVVTVVTSAQKPVLSDPSDLEFGPGGDLYVSVSAGSGARGIARVAVDGSAAGLIVDELAPLGGRSFVFAGGESLYYMDAAVEPGTDGRLSIQLHRLAVSALPAIGGTPVHGEAGAVLGGPGNWMTRGGALDMAFGPDGLLYINWAATEWDGSVTGYDAELWRVAPGSGGAVDFTPVYPGPTPGEPGEELGAQTRFAFGPKSSTLYMLCLEGPDQYLEDECGFSLTRRLGYGATDASRIVGSMSQGAAVGTPGQLHTPRGIVVSRDGDGAWIADAGNRRISWTTLPDDPGRLSPLELCATCNPGEKRLYTPTVADPVGLATGNLTESAIDIAVAARGPALAVSRTYNSLRAGESGLFGPGWSSNLDIELQVDAWSVTVRQENGSALPFVSVVDGPDQNGDVSFAAPARVTSALTQRADGSYRLVRNKSDVVTFDSNGRVTGFEDRNGYRTTVSYPSSTQMVVRASTEPGQASPAGRQLTLTLNGAGLVTSVSDDSSPARTVSYGYTDGRLTSVTSFKMNAADALPVSWGYAYTGAGDAPQPAGLLKSVTDGRGHANETHYDAEGRADWQTDFGGARTDFDYFVDPADPAKTWTTVTYPANNGSGVRPVERYDFTDLLLVAKTTGYGTASARTVSFEYQPGTLGLTTARDHNGNVVTAHTYYESGDWRGNVKTSTDARGRVTEVLAYNEWDEPLQVKDPAGTVTTLTYDGYGNLTSSSTPIVSSSGAPVGTATLTLHRDDEADPATAHDGVAHPDDVLLVTDPGQHGAPSPKRWEYAYRPDGQLAWSETPDDERTVYGYDTRGLVTSVESPKGYATASPATDYETTFVRNDFGMVTTSTDALGKSTNRVFDGNGNTIRVTDAKQQVAKATYDNMDRPLEETEAFGSPAERATSTTYWPDGSLRAQVNGLGQSTNYSYDVHGAVLTSTDAKGRTTTLVYEEATGRLKNRVDPGGNCGASPSGCVTYGYHGHSAELNTIDYSDPNTPDVTAVGYNTVGLRTSMTQAFPTGAKTTSWVFDSAGRLESSTDINGRTTGYGWDLDGNRTSVVYPDGLGTVTYTFDATGRMTSADDSVASRTTSFDYDDNSNWTDTVFPSGAGDTDVRGYDPADRLTSVEWRNDGAVLGRLDYTPRDDNGLVTAESVTGSTGLTGQSWAYDQADQLDVVNGAAVDFDDAGNLTRTPEGRYQAFDAAQQLCWASPTTTGTCGGTVPGDATTYSHDARGNRTGRVTATGAGTLYGYDGESRLTSVWEPGRADPGGYLSLSATRVADTRTTTQTGTCNGGTCVRLTAGQTVTVQVAGIAGLPAVGAASAVSGTVTAINPSAAGYLKVNPEGGAAAAATVNYGSGTNESSTFIARLDPQGRITISSTAATDLVVDIGGIIFDGANPWGGEYAPLTAARAADTRPLTRMGSCNGGGACNTLTAGQATTVKVTDTAGVPATGVTAVVVSVSVVAGSTAGNVKINPNGTSQAAGQVQVEAGETDNIALVAGVNASGEITLLASVAVDAIVDVSGYFTTAAGPGVGGLELTATPERVADTRNGTGSCTATTCARIPAGGRVDIVVEGDPGVDADAMAVVAAITIINPAAAGAARIAPNTPTGLGTSGAATVNYTTGASADVSAIVPVNPDGTITIATTAAIDVVVDVTGAFYPYQPWTYTYDATGLRTAKQHGPATPTQFSWDRASGMPLLLATHDAGGATRIVYGPGATPLYQVNGAGQVLYYRQDQLGSTRLTTDSTGATYGAYRYDAYGKQTTVSVPLFGTPPTLAFQGQYTDAETGFIYLRARYMDPTTGQFLTRDPLEPLTRDPYNYTGGNPVNAVDPGGYRSRDNSRYVISKPPEITDVSDYEFQGVDGVLPFYFGSVIGSGAVLTYRQTIVMKVYQYGWRTSPRTGQFERVERVMELSFVRYRHDLYGPWSAADARFSGEISWYDDNLSLTRVRQRSIRTVGTDCIGTVPMGENWSMSDYVNDEWVQEALEDAGL